MSNVAIFASSSTAFCRGGCAMMAQLPDISIQNRQQAELTNWNDNPSRGKQSGISATTGNKLRQLTDFATLPSSSKAPKRREAAQAALAKISPVFAIKRDAARTLITDTVITCYIRLTH